jgi:tyrosyl-tRNA synthetase
VERVILQPGKDGEVDVIQLLVEQGITKTKNEARRLIKQGGVKLNQVVLRQPAVKAEQVEGLLQVGSRHFRQLVLRKASG